MGDAKAILVLTAGDEIRVQQSVEELRALVADAPRGDVAFMRVIDERGQVHEVNVREVVEFREPAS